MIAKAKYEMEKEGVYGVMLLQDGPAMASV
jgi:hypothetical protein